MQQWTLQPAGLAADARAANKLVSDPGFTQIAIGSHRVYVPTGAHQRSDVANMWLVEHIPYPLCAPVYPTHTVFHIDASASAQAFSKDEAHAFVASVCNITKLGPQSILRALRDVTFRSGKHTQQHVRGRLDDELNDDDADDEDDVDVVGDRDQHEPGEDLDADDATDEDADEEDLEDEDNADVDADADAEADEDDDDDELEPEAVADDDDEDAMNEHDADDDDNDVNLDFEDDADDFGEDDDHEADDEDA